MSRLGRSADLGASVGAGLGSGRTPALLLLLTLTTILAATLIVTTPWRPLEAPAGQRVQAAPSRDFTAAERAREDAFHREVRPPAYLSLAAALLTAAALGFTSAGARLVEAAGGLGGGGWLARVLLGGLALALVTRVVALPFDAWAETIMRRYGLSTRDWLGWLADVGRGFAVSTAVLLIAGAVLIGLARGYPRSWWLPAAAGGALLVALLSFAYPVLVEPVFNRFTPLRDDARRDALVRLADEAGVPVRDVLVADQSKRTSRLNAYVSGLGATRRIVVYDTLLARASPAEVDLVVAHELGHARRRDVAWGTAVGAVGLAAGTVVIALLVSTSGLLRRAGADAPGDPRALALVLAVSAVLGFAASPLQNLVSRRVEARADVFALDLTRDPTTFVAMQRRLATANLADLDPPALVYGLFASHPTAPERIALARTWARVNGAPVPGERVP